MSLSKLSIFSKDTDAIQVVKGYEYQKSMYPNPYKTPSQKNIH